MISGFWNHSIFSLVFEFFECLTFFPTLSVTGWRTDTVATLSSSRLGTGEWTFWNIPEMPCISCLLWIIPTILHKTYLFHQRGWSSWGVVRFKRRSAVGGWCHWVILDCLMLACHGVGRRHCRAFYWVIDLYHISYILLRGAKSRKI